MALARYRLALRTPGVGRALFSSLVARLPNGMSGLAILLLVTRHHNYAGAGVVTGIYVAGSGASNLLLSRAADRLGARVVLVPTAVAYAAGTVALALIPGRRYLLELVAAALTGLVSPPVVPVVRGLWPRVLEPDVVQVVYGLEATAQELVYITGPALVALIAAAAGAAAAVVATGACALAGTLAFAAAPLLRSARRPVGHERHRLMRTTRLPAYVVMAFTITIAFTMTEVGIVAFVSGRRASAASGVVLALWSVGSLLGGLRFGAAEGRVDDHAVARAVALIAGGIALAAVAPGTVGLAVVMFLGGVAIAPGLARLYARVGAVAPEGVATEAFGWVGVGLLAGSSLGAALGGVTVDALGARLDFVVAATAPSVAVLAFLGWLRARGVPARVREPLPS